MPKTGRNAKPGDVGVHRVLQIAKFGYTESMTELLNKAFEAASKLPQEQQDALARELLARLAADARWPEIGTV